MDTKDLVALILVVTGIILIVTGLPKLPGSVTTAAGIGDLPIMDLIKSQVGIGVLLVIIGAAMLSPEILSGTAETPGNGDTPSPTPS